MTEDPQQHLDDHYGNPSFHLVDEPTGGGKGMTSKEASTFLRLLQPVLRTGRTLRDAAKKLANGS